MFCTIHTVLGFFYGVAFTKQRYPPIEFYLHDDIMYVEGLTVTFEVEVCRNRTFNSQKELIEYVSEISLDNLNK